jgi:CBS domain containing-hemolysin-like protein
VEDPDDSGPAGGWLAPLAFWDGASHAGGLDPWSAAAMLASLALATFGAVASTALLVYSPTKLRSWPDGGEAAARLLHERGPDLLITATALTLAGVAGTLLEAGGTPGWERVLVVLGVSLALLALCGALPQAIAASRAEPVLLRALPALRAAYFVLRFPVVAPLAAIERAVVRALRVPDAPAVGPDQFADEILAAVTDTDRENALEDDEKGWIANIVALKDMVVGSVMTPRTDVVAVDAEASLLDAAAKATESGHSRCPVYDGEVDNVIGVIYTKDILALLDDDTLEGKRVRDIAREPLFAPESMRVGELLRQFKASKVQMAVVLDEYGGTAGLVTLEDILEEIVGDLADEHDQEDGPPLRIVSEGSVAELSGRTRIEEFNQALDLNLPVAEDYDTVAGFIFRRLGRIPPVGATFQIDGLEFTVLRGNARQLWWLRVRTLAAAPGGAS